MKKLSELFHFGKGGSQSGNHCASYSWHARKGNLPSFNIILSRSALESARYEPGDRCEITLDEATRQITMAFSKANPFGLSGKGKTLIMKFASTSAIAFFTELFPKASGPVELKLVAITHKAITVSLP